MHSYPHCTCESLFQKSEFLIYQLYDYYARLSQMEGGDCYDFRQMSDAVKFFNPIYFKGVSAGDIIVSLNELDGNITR